jgi:plasmid replication initiation protein
VSASYGEYRYGVRAQGPWARMSWRITGSRERWRHASDTEALRPIETEYSVADDRVKPESGL